MQSKPRIVSLCPSNTELVHALGLSDCLVGVDNYSDYPATVLQALPRLGPDLNIDMDKVVALKPDLTIASLSVPGMEHVVSQLTSTGLPYVVLSPHSIEDIFDDLHTLTQALSGLGTTSRSEKVVGSLRNRVERIQVATQHVAVRPSIYWEWWPRPVFSPARNNWLTEVSQVAGATNLFADVEGDQVQDDGSLVISRNPDYFLAVWTGVPQHKVPLTKILNRDGWEALPAIREKRLFILSEGLYCRPSPRLIDGLEQLVGLVHPDIASALELQTVEKYAPVRNIDGDWLGSCPSE